MLHHSHMISNHFNAAVPFTFINQFSIMGIDSTGQKTPGIIHCIGETGRITPKIAAAVDSSINIILCKMRPVIKYPSVKSRLQLKTDLLSKGIRADIVETALEELTQEDELEQIRGWIRKKRYDPQTAGEEEKNALIRFLMRKGFSYGMIKNALTDNF